MYNAQFLLFIGIISVEKSLLPVLVDEEKALICFLSIPWTFADSHWRFTVANAAGLKLHASIYHLLEASDHSLVLNQKINEMTVMYRTEFFYDQDLETLGEVHFRNILAELRTYDFAPFEDFYWSSNEVQNFYKSHRGDHEFDRDTARAEKWNNMKDYFTKSVDSFHDICDFSTWAGSAEFQDVGLLICKYLMHNYFYIFFVVQGKLTLPLSAIVGDSKTFDGTLITSCLAYAVAALASDPSVNFVTITQP